MAQRLPFSEQLKRERQLRGWSQERLADEVGCGVKTVQRWELGKTLPQASLRPRICELFARNAEELGLLEEQESASDNVAPLSPSAPAIQETPLSAPQTNDEILPSPSAPSVEEDLLSSQDTVEEPFSPPGMPHTEGIPPLPVREIRPPLVYDIHPSWVVALAWEPCGTRIASAGGDGTVHIWDADTGQHLRIYRGHEHKRNGFLAKTAFLPTVYIIRWLPLHNQARIASAGDGKAVHIWNPDTGETILKYEGHVGLLPNVYAVDWSPDGTRIASACSSTGIDKTVHIWDTKTGETILRYKTPCGLLPNFSVLALDWSPDGAKIASVCSNGKVYIWNAATGEIDTYTTPSDWVRDVAWSPDSRWLAVANGDYTIQIWDTLTNRVFRTYSGHTDSLRNIAWSPNGMYLASASNDHTIRVWNVATGDTLFVYRGHTHWTTAVAWSPDGAYIASASNDKTVQIWQPFASPVETYV